MSEPMNVDGMERVDQKEINAIMSKYDRESAYRTLTGYRGLIISGVCILFSLLQLYSTWFIIPSTHMRPLHLGIVLMLAFLLYPASRKASKKKLPWYDVVLALLSLVCFLYPVVFFDTIARQVSYQTYQIVIGVVGVLLLLEGCRRVVGMPIVIIACCFVLIGIFGKYMPGFLGNRGFSIKNIVKHLFYTQEGVFGTPIGASSTFIFLFILFGSFLEKTGVGEFFIDLCNAIAGSRRQGGCADQRPGGHGFRQLRCQHGRLRQLYHSHDEKLGLPARVCRCGGGGRFYRRSNHAARYGRCGLPDGGNGGNPLFRDCQGGYCARAAVFCRHLYHYGPGSQKAGSGGHEP